MASRTDLTLESVREFILFKGGKVTNHDLVKHFKDVLTNPDTRAEARNEFKEIVNTLATIVRSDEGEKYLVLKKRYRNSENLPQASSPSVTPEPALAGVSGSSSVYPRRGSSTSSLSNFSTSQDSLEQFFTPTNRQPPPYRPPPPPVSPSSLSSPSVQPHHIVNYNSSIPPTSAPTSPASSPSITSLSNYSDQQYIPTSPSDTPRSPSSSSSTDPPPVPPRRKSSEKIKMDNSNKENVIDINKRPKTIGAESNEDISVDQDSKISVKECMQKFNRLASETALQKTQLPSGSNINNKKKSGKETPDRDEEDSVSLTSLGPKGKEWLIKACQCDYHALAKLSSENHLLPRLKCPFTTALHWAAKHGKEDAVKLLAGTHKVDVNSRTGYTPLHIAMQFGHQDIYDLLVQVYGADSNIRDWSGRKPRQYQTNKDTAVSADTFRKIKARKKLAEKELGFLRIGSLNVRVKRTTEAFSNFLGVGHNVDKIHKSWGSADNIPLDDCQKMPPPPKFAPIKKRKSRRAHDFSRPASQQNLSDFNGSDTISTGNPAGDSDSDTAAGFGSTWQSTV